MKKILFLSLLFSFILKAEPSYWIFYIDNEKSNTLVGCEEQKNKDYFKYWKKVMFDKQGKTLLYQDDFLTYNVYGVYVNNKSMCLDFRKQLLNHLAR